jgi:HTH-type transcriptional regulator/antitoxin HipB
MLMWEEYVRDREARDPGFREACERRRPRFEFGCALIGARLDAGLTRRAMAERLGVKQSALARWEAGETMPTLDTLFRVAKALNLEFAITPDSSLVVTAHCAV